VNLKAEQLGRQIGKSIAIRRPTRADFEDVVSSFDVAHLSHTLPECVTERRNRVRGRKEEPYSVNFPCLLRFGGKAYAKSA
jgi:hypothetical protein